MATTKHKFISFGFVSSMFVLIYNSLTFFIVFNVYLQNSFLLLLLLLLLTCPSGYSPLLQKELFNAEKKSCKMAELFILTLNTETGVMASGKKCCFMEPHEVLLYH